MSARSEQKVERCLFPPNHWPPNKAHHLSPFSESTFVRLLWNASRALANGCSGEVQWSSFFRLCHLVRHSRAL